MADKGFTIQELLQSKKASLVIPPLLGKRDKFSKDCHKSIGALKCLLKPWRRCMRIPLANDIKCLNVYIKEKASELSSTLESMPDEKIWRELSEVTPAQVALFNRSIECYRLYNLNVDSVLCYFWIIKYIIIIYIYLDNASNRIGIHQGPWLYKLKTHISNSNQLELFLPEMQTHVNMRPKYNVTMATTADDQHWQVYRQDVRFRDRHDHRCRPKKARKVGERGGCSPHRACVRMAASKEFVKKE